jgi:predicted RNA binding protein YcfA (HicA-like mRNA interferase family)
MKYRDLIALLEDDGWQHVRTSGSHRIYRHGEKAGIIVVPVHSTGHDVPRGLLSAIMKQAGIKR